MYYNKARAYNDYSHTRRQHTCRFTVDKRRATNNEWQIRIPEKYLFLCGILGGAIGGYCAMLVLTHKTKKKKFCVPYTVLFVLNVLVVLVVLFVLN